MSAKTEEDEHVAKAMQVAGATARTTSASGRRIRRADTTTRAQARRSISTIATTKGSQQPNRGATESCRMFCVNVRNTRHGRSVTLQVMSAPTSCLASLASATMRADASPSLRATTPNATAITMICKVFPCEKGSTRLPGMMPKTSESTSPEPPDAAPEAARPIPKRGTDTAKESTSARNAQAKLPTSDIFPTRRNDSMFVLPLMPQKMHRKMSGPASMEMMPRSVSNRGDRMAVEMSAHACAGKAALAANPQARPRSAARSTRMPTPMGRRGR